jgi:hypothetical protein
MKRIAAIAVLTLAGACAAQNDVATAYDDADYPLQNTALVEPAPGNAGRIVITAAGGRPVQCGSVLSRTECQRVRLMPGTTVLRLDFAQTVDGRESTAKDMDLPISVQGGHTYQIVANVVRTGAPGAPPGRGGARVQVHAVDKGLSPSSAATP